MILCLTAVRVRIIKNKDHNQIEAKIKIKNKNIKERGPDTLLLRFQVSTTTVKIGMQVSQK